MKFKIEVFFYFIYSNIYGLEFHFLSVDCLNLMHTGQDLF